jgi:hypothetical protein
MTALICAERESDDTLYTWPTGPGWRCTHGAPITGRLGECPQCLVDPGDAPREPQKKGRRAQ